MQNALLFMCINYPPNDQPVWLIREFFFHHICIKTTERKFYCCLSGKRPKKYFFSKQQKKNLSFSRKTADFFSAVHTCIIVQNQIWWPVSLYLSPLERPITQHTWKNIDYKLKAMFCETFDWNIRIQWYTLPHRSNILSLALRIFFLSENVCIPGANWLGKPFSPAEAASLL